MTERTFVRVKVTGPWACFSRPELKVERVSYEVMTPSAARGMLDAILWKPQMRWIVTRILVLRPIRFLSIRRNEVEKKISPRAAQAWMRDPETFEPLFAGAGAESATPRNTLALRDVGYVIEAEPHVYSPTADDTPTKFMAMMNRRVERGQCSQRPYFGCREFAADFGPALAGDRPVEEDRDLGPMLYDIVYGRSEKRPVFFSAALCGGVLDTHPDRAVADESTRRELLACSSAN